MRNGCAENHFDVDSVKNNNKVSPNDKKKLSKDYLLFCLGFFVVVFFFSLFNFQESNITKFLEKFFYVVGKKSQQIFHTMFDQFHQEKWIFMNRVTIIAQ